jgi:hypothetical protein
VSDSLRSITSAITASTGAPARRTRRPRRDAEPIDTRAMASTVPAAPLRRNDLPRLAFGTERYPSKQSLM